MEGAATRFVGREDPLEILGQAAASARDRNRATVLIEGETGIGKTRLLDEALARSRNPKDTVAIGHGVELPYGTA